MDAVATKSSTSIGEEELSKLRKQMVGPGLYNLKKRAGEDVFSGPCRTRTCSSITQEVAENPLFELVKVEL
jgi:hypothetical protein